MSAELSTKYRKMLTDAVVHGRISASNDATGNEAPSFDADAAEGLVTSGHLARDGEGFVITEKGRHAERKSFAEQEGHARDEVPQSTLRNTRG